MLKIIEFCKMKFNFGTLHSPVGKELIPITKEVLDDRKSLFAVYPDDFHNPILPQKKTSKNEFDFLLSINFIGDLEMAILRIVSDLRYATSIQIYNMLKIKGLDVERTKVQTVIKKLKNKSFLKQIGFYNGTVTETQTVLKAYSLGYHGVGIFRLRNEETKLQGYISQMPTRNIKKVLATNQLLISIFSVMKISFESLICVVYPDIKDAIIRTSSVINCNDSTYFVECVRRDENWDTVLKERITRYKKVIDNDKKLNITVNTEPVVIFLAEDYEHMKEVKNLIGCNLGFKYMFTYDTILLEDINLAFFKA